MEVGCHLVKARQQNQKRQEGQRAPEKERYDERAVKRPRELFGLDAREETGELLVSALHDERTEPMESVRYRPGEGIVGTILSSAEPIIVRRIADEPRFLDRLGVYKPDLPFIGVPINIGENETVGVFAAQPSRT